MLFRSNRPGAKKNDGQEPDWFGVELWGEQAQAFADACHKGDLVDVTGRVRSERWQDKTTGEDRSQLVIAVETWSPVGQAAPVNAPVASSSPPAGKPPVFISRNIDDEVPF